jgi:hypothetical protein
VTKTTTGFLALVAAVLAALSSGCGQKPQTVTLRSLESSGKMSFLCLGRNYLPRNIDDCPDQNLVDDENTRRLYALVAQRTRGEVALVDLLGGTVVDEEPSVLGFNFLPVGAQPTSIVSTPGGLATFVAVAEVGKEGIFALPTSCVAPRKNSEPVRDITTWPACRLPSPPGEMALLVDDAESCPSSQSAPACDPTKTDFRCPEEADLSCETKQPGRRKLAVAFPDLGQIGIIDAQTILKGVAGQFDPCVIEYSVPLHQDLPATPLLEQLPPDLAHPAGFEFPPAISYGPDQTFSSRPAGFAQLDDPRTGEHRLFVADLDAPVIHDLDTSEPCRMADTKPPLLPASFLDSAGASSAVTGFVGRNVVTNKVAVSPLSTDGQRRYLYAIDELGNGNGGGSVMIFDVSPSSSERTPLVRSNAARFPFEAPDRLAFGAPAKDVAFALRDPALPDPATGVAAVGVLCDPDPALPLDAPGAKYRSLPDYSSGAGATNLRGIFGFLALSTGDIAVIDVEDFDAPCRRPRITNSLSTPDFRGCAKDSPSLPTDLAIKDIATVTDEASCHAIEPHRARSGSLVLNTSDRGTHAPALRSLPKLIDKQGRSLSVDASTEGRSHPRMLGVNFSEDLPGDARHAGAAQVYVGTTLFSRFPTGTDSPLVIDPTSADAVQNSLVLSFDEPRAYAPTEDFSARYEGPLFEERPAGRFDFDSVSGRSTLTDAAADFCGRGVEDQNLAKIRAGKDLGVAAADVETFGEEHADFVRITSDLLDEGDAYWKQQQCGDTGGGGGFLHCRSLFGTSAAPSVNRELRIVKATVDTLTVESRVAPHGSRKSDAVSELIACCFPETMSYEVRASNEWIVRGSGSGFRHNVVTSASSDRACALDPSPLKTFLRSRVVEVSCDPTSPACASGGKAKSIGLANADPSSPSVDVACVVPELSEDTRTLGKAPCIYQGLSASFVIYRGQLPSERDMEFDWEVRGGFTPLTVSLASTDTNSTPENMVFSPQLGHLVLDGAAKGLVTIDLGTFGITQYY